MPRRKRVVVESARPLTSSPQTAPLRHRVRLPPRPRLSWAGRLGVGPLRRGLRRGAGASQTHRRLLSAAEWVKRKTRRPCVRQLLPA
jgi:hypothetical protein